MGLRKQEQRWRLLLDDPATTSQLIYTNDRITGSTLLQLMISHRTLERRVMGIWLEGPGTKGVVVVAMVLVVGEW